MRLQVLTIIQVKSLFNRDVNFRPLLYYCSWWWIIMIDTEGNECTWRCNKSIWWNICSVSHDVSRKIQQKEKHELIDQIKAYFCVWGFYSVESGLCAVQCFITKYDISNGMSLDIRLSSSKNKAFPRWGSVISPQKTAKAP